MYTDCNVESCLSTLQKNVTMREFALLRNCSAIGILTSRACLKKNAVESVNCRCRCLMLEATMLRTLSTCFGEQLYFLARLFLPPMSSNARSSIALGVKLTFAPPRPPDDDADPTIVNFHPPRRLKICWIASAHPRRTTQLFCKASLHSLIEACIASWDLACCNRNLFSRMRLATK